ncbi:MAG: superoxide dismutase [Candidatus Peribacteraceae bacterium]|nr:superoxide dismutase [Candidatus Peribacteraceae bacterium]MDD5740166.1 superoxide dismutase [Candidatus Peribacteraceae bacterium]
MPYVLPKLDFAFDALEPHIDARTMEVHYGKHHQTYCDNINKALVGSPWAEKPIEEVLKNLNKIPDDKRTAVRNHGGGFANHNFFWTCLSSKSAPPTGKFLEALQKSFGSLDAFKEKFEASALGQFGSGWAWLVFPSPIDKSPMGSLEILNLPNQDSPLSIGKIPLLCLDVWEHAYYLKYLNRRAEYVKAFWQVVNWAEVARRYSEEQ